MSDPREDDAQFKDWLSNRPPHNEDDDVPASVTFMEMMRQAAARQERANAPVPRVEPSPERSPVGTAVDVGESIPLAEHTSAPSPDSGGTGGGSGSAGGGDSGGGSPKRDSAPAPRPRRVKRGRRTISAIGGFVRTMIIVVIAAGLMATIFTWWTPNAFLSDEVRAGLSAALVTQAPTVAPTTLPTPNWARRIGIVSGHRGPQNDPGAVCPDGLKEADIVFDVAQRVVTSLRGLGYTVDLLDEFDPRLENYQATALVSIHANTCQSWGNEIVSGYLIAAAAARVSARGNDDVLVECIAGTYAASVGLQRRAGVTVDMTDYHTFREIHPLTPAAILELGFMLADRQILTERQDDMARGITDGILCFLNPPL
ncbi:MAG: N-acetylmuramoyl-L-alanine amidase [Anaerolinea sp.]|nr:N-acetylmuramoyl-L-alanine amidase [Anaerolinea sp.]